VKLFVIGTPKAIASIETKHPHLISKVKSEFPGVEIVLCAENMVYMNMLSPEWTEDKCDETIYLMREDELPTKAGFVIN
jgi:hypothetical protein